MNRRVWIIDLLAALFVLGLIAWNMSKIGFTPPLALLFQDRWSNASFSDFLTQLAGQRFATEGFLQNYLLSNMTVGYPEFSRGWYYYQVPIVSPNSAIFYTHYGSFDAVVNGLLRGLLGMEALGGFYKLISILSLFSLGLWYFVASRIFGKIVGLVSLVFTGTTIFYLRFLETNASYSWDLILAFSAVFLFLLAYKFDSRKKVHLALLALVWAVVYLQASNSPEWILWLQFFFFGYLWAFRGNPLPVGLARHDGRFAGLRWNWTPASKTALLILSAPVVAVSLHLAQNAWALGGVPQMLEDVLAALQRRTTGFGLAVEEPVKGLELGDVVPLVDNMLRTTMQMGLVNVLALTALLVAAYYSLKRSLSLDSKYAPLAKMLAMLLLGGISFWVVLPQATVSSMDTTLRTILPFTGILIGGVGVLAFGAIRGGRGPVLVRAVTLAALIILMLPFGLQRVTAEPFNVERWYGQGPPYTGLLPTEIRLLSTFVRDNTKYGDIVLTGINTGDTGHRQYPHPAWEYFSGRRIEVVRDSREAVERIREFERVRASLPVSNPASRVRYYLLSERWGFSDLERLGALAGEQVGDFSLDDWWQETAGGGNLNNLAVSLDDIGKVGEQPFAFSLHRINPGLLSGVPESLAPIKAVEPSRRYSIKEFQKVRLAGVDTNGLLPGRGPQFAVDGNPESFWHIEWPPATLVHWLRFDAGKPVSPELISITPRMGAPAHFWDGVAVLQGSADGQGWTPVAALKVDRLKDVINADGSALVFPVDAGAGYRYFRLVIINQPVMSYHVYRFQALADVSLLIHRPPAPGIAATTGVDILDYRKLVVPPGGVTADSYNKETEKPQNLVDGNPNTYWHVKSMEQPSEHWVRFALDAPAALSLVAVTPRRGFTDQLWSSNTALLGGSDDGLSWTAIGRLELENNRLDKAGTVPLYFKVEAARTFKYYRVLMEDDSGFLSASELELFSAAPG